MRQIQFKRPTVTSLIAEAGVIVEQEHPDFTVLRGDRDMLEKALDFFDLTEVAPAIPAGDIFVTEVFHPGGPRRATVEEERGWLKELKASEE